MTTTFDTSGIVDAEDGQHIALDGQLYIGVGWGILSPFTQGYIEAMPWETLRPALGWPVTYEGRHFGYMQTATPLEALAKVRSDNPHHAAGRFHVQGVGFYSLAPETLARIIADCEAAFPVHFGGATWSDEDNRAAGRGFWTCRSARKSAFPPLTVQLGDDGKVRFSERG